MGFIQFHAAEVRPLLDLDLAPAVEEGALDFARMTPRLLLASVDALLKAGRLDLDESTALFALLPIPLDGGDPLKSPAYNQPIDFFERLQQVIEFDDSIHSRDHLAYGLAALAVLERFQGQTLQALTASR